MFTQEQLTQKTGPELVEIFNSLDGVTPVKRFTNREAGVKRILASLEVKGIEVEITTTEIVSVPTKRGRKKMPRGVYNEKGGVTKRSYRVNSARGQLLSLLLNGGATFTQLQAEFPQWNEDQLHGTIRMLARWLGFDLSTDESGILRASR